MNELLLWTLLVLLVVAIVYYSYSGEVNERMTTKYYAHDIIAKCPTPPNDKDKLLFKCENKNLVSPNDLIVEPGYKSGNGQYTMYRLKKDMEIDIGKA